MTTSSHAAADFAFDSPTAAIAALTDQLDTVATEVVSWSDAIGRVLAEPVQTDRPSPAVDVSAMDGYAMRLADVADGATLTVSDEAVPGQPVVAMQAGQVVRIFTGAPVPADAEVVIPREYVDERDDAITLSSPCQVKPGQHIRRAGENAAQGQTVLQPGDVVTPAAMMAMAAFGGGRVCVYRKLRVGAIVTGDEVRQPGEAVSPWQLRDSNGPALQAMFSPVPFIQWASLRYACDDRQTLRQVVAEQLAACDVLLLTGGVSMGDYDFVPDVLRELGAQVVFHRLPQRPGKPVLGAIGPQGQAVLGLPGNPVSVMTTARRFGAAAMRKRAGAADVDVPTGLVTLDADMDKKLPLWWSRPVRLAVPGHATLVANRGSGDVVGTARSDGFVVVGPSASGRGPWPFYAWRM